MSQNVKSIILRFIRAFVAGAVATMLTVIPLTSGSWNDLGNWLSALGLAGIIGGISGLLMALDKYLRI
jgi:hypothetical protein